MNVRGPVRLAVLTSCLLTGLTAEAAVVLQYHHVSEDTPASTSTSPKRFEAHLEYLAQQKFRVVSLLQLVDALRQEETLPDDVVAITFDDGYRSIYETAYPLLKQRGWPFTVFINSEPHDQGRPLYMSWQELREMSENGATIANHTVSHPSLIARQAGQSEADWRAAVTREIEGAQTRIRQEIGSDVRLLAYPFGEFDRAVRAIAAAGGYAAFGQNSGPLARHNDLQALPRFPFGGSFGDPRDFAVKVSSLPMPLAAGNQAVRWQDSAGRALEDMVLDGPRAQPMLVLKFPTDPHPPRISCFASSQGPAEVRHNGAHAEIQAVRPMGPGHFRYNCTAPSSQEGRFYWFSQQWIVLSGNNR